MSNWATWLNQQLSEDSAPELAHVVEAVASIGPLRTWTPSLAQTRNVWNNIVHLGISLMHYSNTLYVDRLVDKLAGQLRTRGRFDPDDLAELDGGAAVARLGADFFIKVPEDGQTRVPDFAVAWGWNDPDEKAFAVAAAEVTKAKEKPENKALYSYAARLIDDVIKCRECHFELSIAGKLTESERSELLRVAKQGAVGNQYGAEGRWELKIGSLGWQSDGWSFRNGREEYPEWWPQTFQTGNVLSGPGKLTAKDGRWDMNYPDKLSQIRFPFKHDRYIKTIEAKAENFQGSQEAPFIIVLDAAGLPDYTPGLRGQLDQRFPRWPHVSAVVAFQRVSSFPRHLGFETIFINPDAKHPLPSAAMKDAPPSNCGYRTWSMDFYSGEFKGVEFRRRKPTAQVNG